jgi:thioredoxin-like negative regulator of GroEL
MGPAPDPARARADFERTIRLDPNNVQVRLDYARLLAALGDRTAAADQYRAALRFNDLLHPDEPKRLRPEELREVEKALAGLAPT